MASKAHRSLEGRLQENWSDHNVRLCPPSCSNHIMSAFEQPFKLRASESGGVELRLGPEFLCHPCFRRRV
ncbi:hypothetical protein BDQ94DRAFT_147881 [Aspergillus welwitschiae]|uniref:Uncharacterized protein n=1 Tax=Aspergillus welwitschiae TaxID=1341132 RepID=A0A3F3PVP8_9EURO|nr:hypothetical protein BDQ94DRAFT_147881 [Aspergillus welwitschiae]RDH31001.1 hypothetical protein BDQ94DRAFT_147881 [Aspergillus welwitschiae]